MMINKISDYLYEKIKYNLEKLEEIKENEQIEEIYLIYLAKIGLLNEIINYVDKVKHDN